MRTETLVAIDWNDAGLSIAPVTDFIVSEGLGQALVKVGLGHHVKPNGEEVALYKIVFDADRVRNTNVHGAGYRAGFICHCE